MENGSFGARDKYGEWHEENEIWRLWEETSSGEELFAFDFPKMVRIVLTVAHLGTPHEDGTAGDKRDKMDVRDENLAALCQRCHLNYDRDEHVQNRRRNREKRENVQPMFEDAT